MNRICIFIDGENLRHSLRRLYAGDQEVDKQYPSIDANWRSWFEHLCEQATGNHNFHLLRTYWYVMDKIAFYPPLKKLSNSRNVNDINEWMALNDKGLQNHRQHWNDCLDRWGAAETEEDKINIAKELYTNLREHRGKREQRFKDRQFRQDKIAQNNRAVQFCRSGEITYSLLAKKFGTEKTVDVNMAVDMVDKAENFDMALIISGDQDCVPAVQRLKDRGKQVINIAFEKDGKLLPGGAKRLNETTDWSIRIDKDKTEKILALDKKSKAQEARRQKSQLK